MNEANTIANDNLLTSVKDHLEFAGYAVEVTNDEKPRLKAKHPYKTNLWARRFRGGVLFSAPFLCTEEGKKKRDELLRLVNLMNETAAVTHSYADKDNDLIIEGWYPATYVKQDFGVFLDNLLGDIDKGFAAGAELAKTLLA
jgi:hypothetical protein